MCGNDDKKVLLNEAICVALVAMTRHTILHCPGNGTLSDCRGELGPLQSCMVCPAAEEKRGERES